MIFASTQRCALINKLFCFGPFRFIVVVVCFSRIHRYMPIIPTILINGAEGIGTGWSTSVPNYNPRDIVDNIKRLLRGEEVEPMVPWYKSFKGTIDEVMTKTGRSYVINGIISQIDDTTLEISELPIRKWTQDYKEFLEELLKPEAKNATPLITDYKEYHTDVSVRFVIKMTPQKLQEAMEAGLHSKFKLTTKISIGNMMLFGADGIIKKYEGPEDILREFFDLRMEYYVRRKAALLRAAEAELLRISNKVRFILAVVSGDIKLSNRRRADIEAELEAKNFDRLPSTKKAALVAAAAVDQESEGEDTGVLEAEKTYEYLLSMPLSSLTLEKVESLQSEAGEKDAEVKVLRSTTEADMWTRDLDAFMEAYAEFEEEEARKEIRLARQQAKILKEESRKGKAASKKSKAKGKGKKKKNAWSDDDDDSEISDDDCMFSDEEDFIVSSKNAPPHSTRGRIIAPPKPTSTVTSATSSDTTMAVGVRKSKKPSAPVSAANSAASSVTAHVSSLLPPPPQEEEMSLVQRMAMRLGSLAINNTGNNPDAGALPSCGPLSKEAAAAVEAVSKPRSQAGKKRASKAKKKPVKIDTSDEEESEVDDVVSDEDEEFVMLDGDDDAISDTGKRPQTSKTTAGGRTKGSLKDSSSASAKTAAAATNTRKPAAGGKGRKASKASARKEDGDVEEDEDDPSVEMSDAESGRGAAPVARGGSRRATRGVVSKITYIESDDDVDDDDGDEDMSEYEESASEDDYCPSD